MSLYKFPLGFSVLDADTNWRPWALNNFDRVCVSFSGGKDSTVMLHLTGILARQYNKKSVYCLLTGKHSSATQLNIVKIYEQNMSML